MASSDYLFHILWHFPLKLGNELKWPSAYNMETTDVLRGKKSDLLLLGICN